MKYLIKKVVDYDSVDHLMKSETGKNIHEISITPYETSYVDAGALTPKQKHLFEILHLKKENPPSLRELTKLLKVGAINTVVQHLKALETKGYIEKTKHRKRFYKLLK